jgi:aspartyl-tRNA(Asn)/glutamyl-tRNA(Gln) amidotransferase subunit A
VCNGYSAAGLPTSLQIAGRPFEDHRVLQAGHAFEKATAYRSVRPVLETVLANAAN